MNDHTILFKGEDAKSIEKGYGIPFAGKTWYWYERWVAVVRQHCAEDFQKYGREILGMAVGSSR